MSVGSGGPIEGGRWAPIEGAGGDAGTDEAAAAPTAAAANVVRNASNTLADLARRAGLPSFGGLPARPEIPLNDVLSRLVANLPPSMRRLISGLPNVGEMGTDVGLSKPAVISSPEFGESSAVPAILEVRVDKTQHGILGVGKKVHEKFFEGYPPFDFNVNFSCHNSSMLSRESEYADPRSPWSNVFFGRYQIDTPIGAPGEADKWTRPFGFTGPDSKEVNFDDIQRIGNADWGYFSNWMYGVPEKDLDAFFEWQKTQPKPTCTVTNPSVTINGKEYVECTVDGIKVPSAYVSGRDGKSLTNNDPLMSPIWRKIFGKQTDGVNRDPATGGVESFAPTDMSMKFYMRQDKRWDPDFNGYVYSTEIYGGGVNKTWAGDSAERQAYNERFLEAQMAAVKDTMSPP